jgi:AraC-like DNA-binding protein
MLALECERAVGGGFFHDIVVLAPAFRAQLLLRDRLLYDTAFTARIPSSPQLVHLMIVTHGSIRVGSRTDHEPVAYLMTDAEFNATEPRGLSFRSWGAPNITLEIALPQQEVTRPVGLAHGPLELSPETWNVARAVAASLADAAKAGPIEPPFLALVGRLAHELITATDLRTRAATAITDNVARVWPVIRQRYAEMAVSTSMLEVAADAGVSLAQAARDFMGVMQTFPYVGTGFREIMLLLRLRLAAQFLSGPTATAREVAQAVGYGSLTAMRRAFRDAGMPTPSAIAAACRFPATYTRSAEASRGSRKRTPSARSTR